MDLELHQKSVFVAGSSRGIGYAVARAFLNEGASVLISGRDGAALEKAMTDLAMPPERLLAYQGNLTEPVAIEQALNLAATKFGAIDVVVGNIGSGTAKPGWEVDAGDWQSVFDTNFMGSMHLSRLSMPYLLASKGCLLLIASIVGIEAVSAPITYSAAKAALVNATKNLAHIVGSQGVRVNAIAPGNILFPNGSWDRKLREGADVVNSYIAREVPLRRFGRPEEIADAATFLASARASFVTGTCLVVDGGQTRSI